MKVECISEKTQKWDLFSADPREMITFYKQLVKTILVGKENKLMNQANEPMAKKTN